MSTISKSKSYDNQDSDYVKKDPQEVVQSLYDFCEKNKRLPTYRERSMYSIATNLFKRGFYKAQARTFIPRFRELLTTEAIDSFIAEKIEEREYVPKDRKYFPKIQDRPYEKRERRENRENRQEPDIKVEYGTCKFFILGRCNRDDCKWAHTTNKCSVCEIYTPNPQCRTCRYNARQEADRKAQLELKRTGYPCFTSECKRFSKRKGDWCGQCYGEIRHHIVSPCMTPGCFMKVYGGYGKECDECRRTVKV